MADGLARARTAFQTMVTCSEAGLGENSAQSRSALHLHAEATELDVVLGIESDGAGGLTGQVLAGYAPAADVK